MVHRRLVANCPSLSHARRRVTAAQRRAAVTIQAYIRGFLERKGTALLRAEMRVFGALQVSVERQKHSCTPTQRGAPNLSFWTCTATATVPAKAAVPPAPRGLRRTLVLVEYLCVLLFVTQPSPSTHGFSRRAGPRQRTSPTRAGSGRQHQLFGRHSRRARQRAKPTRRARHRPQKQLAKRS